MYTATTILRFVHSLLLLFLSLAILVKWFRIREEVSSYKWYGLAAGSVLLLFEALLMLLNTSIFRQPLAVFRVILLGAWSFLRLTAFTLVGIHCCKALGYHNPLMLLQQSELDVITNEVEHYEVVDEGISGIDWRRYLLATITVAAGAIVFSLLLFWATSPSLSDAMRQSSRADRVTFYAVVVVLECAFAEEIVYRLGIQNYVAKQLKLYGGRYWVAIMLTSALWTILHVGMFEPEWVKMMQIFPIGLALGWLFSRFGVESCILAHSLFNVIVLFTASSLVS